MCSPHSILAVYVQSAKGMLNLRSAICSWAGTTHRLSPTLPARSLHSGRVSFRPAAVARPTSGVFSAAMPSTTCPEPAGLVWAPQGVMVFG
jgi:hypothetical protein